MNNESECFTGISKHEKTIAEFILETGNSSDMNPGADHRYLIYTR